MTSIKDTKKGHIIQLRVEKTFLDQLNQLATEQHLTLSVMLRAWLAERLIMEEKRLNVSRLEWQNSRLKEIKKDKSLFEPEPLLIAHAYSKIDQRKINFDKIEHNMDLLAPIFYRTPLTSRINQFGLEVVRQYKDEKIAARGNAFKSGQLETVITVATEDSQIFGRALDTGVIEITQCLCRFLRSQEIEMPYGIQFSLLNAKGMALVVHKIIASSKQLPSFSDDEIRLSEIVVTSAEQFATETNTAEHIIDVLDELWNANGQKYSASFDNNKKWVKS